MSIPELEKWYKDGYQYTPVILPMSIPNSLNYSAETTLTLPMPKGSGFLLPAEVIG